MKGGRSASASETLGWDRRSGTPLHLLVPLAAFLQACAVGPPARAPTAMPSAAHAAPPSRLVVVPDRGALEIALPADWTLARVDRRPGEEGPGATFLLTPSDGRFRITLSPLDLPPGEPPRIEEARRCAEVARAAAEPRAAEPELSLRALKGSAGGGYWFAATDRELLSRAPSPEEWRGVVQGCAWVGELLLGFQVLDDLPGHHRGELLEALAGARHLPPEPVEEPIGLGGTAEAGSELRASFPGRSWSVAVSAPGFTVVPARLDADGGRVRAAMFDHADGVRVRVELWESTASSAVACREPEWASLQGAPGGIADGRTWEEGEWAHASFLRAGRAVARAWHLRDGTCVRAELSTPRAVGTGGYQMILRSLRFVDGGMELEGARRRK